MIVISDKWLAQLTAHHGLAVKHPEFDRWTWQDEEWGVFVDRLTHVWQTVAWAPHRSVTLRTTTEPVDDDINGVVELAGFTRVPEATR